VRAVRDHLIISAIPDATRIARRLARRYRVDEDDFISVAMLGLMKAAPRFNKRRGVKFTTFAQHYVRGAIIDYLRQEGLIPHGELARRRRDPVRAAEAAKYHTARVPYDDIVENVVRDVGQQDERVKAHDRELVLQGMTARLERLTRLRLSGVLAAAVGQEMGVTESRVVQLQRAAEKEIRALMEEEGLVPSDLI
jgi:RNA polymerase sigma factor (sigma-70 family)